MTPKEKLREDFKRALVQTTRAPSALPDVEVAFGGEHAQVQGKRRAFRSPPAFWTRSLLRSHAARRTPQRFVSRITMSALTGAWRRRARMRRPSSRRSKMFAARRSARALKGVGDNLAAALDKSISDRGLDKGDDAPHLAEAAVLLVRERLMARPSPKSASRILDYWREEVERRAGAALDRLAANEDLSDQAAFARLARNMIRDLHLDEEGGEDRGEENRRERRIRTNSRRVRKTMKTASPISPKTAFLKVPMNRKATASSPRSSLSRLKT